MKLELPGHLLSEPTQKVYSRYGELVDERIAARGAVLEAERAERLAADGDTDGARHAARSGKPMPAATLPAARAALEDARRRLASIEDAEQEMHRELQQLVRAEPEVVTAAQRDLEAATARLGDFVEQLHAELELYVSARAALAWAKRAAAGELSAFRPAGMGLAVRGLMATSNKSDTPASAQQVVDALRRVAEPPPVAKPPTRKAAGAGIYVPIDEHGRVLDGRAEHERLMMQPTLDAYAERRAREAAAAAK